MQELILGIFNGPVARSNWLRPVVTSPKCTICVCDRPFGFPRICDCFILELRAQTVNDRFGENEIMTACNGFAMTVSEKRSFFSDLEAKFIGLTSDGKIECKPFLEASRGIATLFDHLGRAFAPVKYDIIGNIEKLEKIYVSDVAKFHTLHDMLRWDIANNPVQSRVAVESLLWLKRALEYVRCFLQFLVDDHQSGTKSENLLPFCLAAYERTLKPYHGWMVQKLCSLCMRSVPWRRDFIKMMAHGREGLDEIVILDMHEYLDEMNVNVDAVVAMYNEWDLNSDVKV